MGEAGSVGTFGERRKKGQDYAGSRPPPINNETFFIRDTDVTEIVDKQGWTLKKPLTARMKKSVVPNLPEPVVIHHDLGKDGDMEKQNTTIALNPKESPRKYGDLIEESGYEPCNKENIAIKKKKSSSFLKRWK